MATSLWALRLCDNQPESRPGLAAHSAQATAATATLGACVLPSTLEQKWESVIKGDVGTEHRMAGIRVHHPQPTQRPGIILSFPSPTFPTAQLFGAPEGLPPKFVLTPSLLLSLRFLDSRLSSLGASHLFPVCSQ